MDITQITSSPIKINQSFNQKPAVDQSKTSFANVLQGYLDDVNTTVKQSEEMTAKVATGEIDNLHDVVIASQKAKLSLDLTVTVRDKAVEAYQEIMRMQI